MPGFSQARISEDGYRNVVRPQLMANDKDEAARVEAIRKAKNDEMEARRESGDQEDSEEVKVKIKVTGYAHPSRNRRALRYARAVQGLV